MTFSAVGWTCVRRIPVAAGAPPTRCCTHQQGSDADGLLKDLQVVMDGAFSSHPGALAHLDPPPLTSSLAAELICAGLNNNLLAEERPLGYPLEQQLRVVLYASRATRLCRRCAGQWGTLSNLMALVVARTAADVESGGFSAARMPMSPWRSRRG